MTWSAPIERSMSNFFVLSTPVTSAPKYLASYTAKVPIVPPAPLIRTFCPLWIFPCLRKCNASCPPTGTALWGLARGSRLCILKSSSMYLGFVLKIKPSSPGWTRTNNPVANRHCKKVRRVSRPKSKCVTMK